jgi:hypothetical protein
LAKLVVEANQQQLHTVSLFLIFVVEHMDRYVSFGFFMSLGIIQDYQNSSMTTNL